MSDWREEILKLANRYYDDGHAVERKAADARKPAFSQELWRQADLYRQVYSDLCALVGKVDPRPGAPEAPARPW